MKMREILEANRIDYRVYPHGQTFDAQHLAADLRVPGDNVAKTVLVRANGGFKYFVYVLPASKRIDLKRLSKALGGAEVHLATELEIADRCPECEFGVLPPFGSQFGMTTLVEESLSKHQDIFFEGDTHDEAIRMNYDDFVRLEHPTTVWAAISPEEAREGEKSETAGVS